MEYHCPKKTSLVYEICEDVVDTILCSNKESERANNVLLAWDKVNRKVVVHPQKILSWYCHTQ